MNLKRSFRMLMCCLAVVGTLSADVLTTEAAMCTHPYLQIAMNVYKEEYHDAYYHYIIYGTQYSCPCGYTYWKDLNKQKSKHTFVTKIEELNGKNVEIVYCSGCGFLP